MPVSVFLYKCGGIVGLNFDPQHTLNLSCVAHVKINLQAAAEAAWSTSAGVSFYFC